MSEDYWIETYTGKCFYFNNPSVQSVDIVDIAHALSNIPRFGGQSKRFYSVAAHSLRVLMMARRYYPDAWDFPKTQDNMTRRGLLFTLLHDATEAYIGDMVMPLKCIMPEFKALEKRLGEVILNRFGLSLVDEPNYLKSIDTIALITEARQLMASKGMSWNLGVVPDTWVCEQDEAGKMREEFMSAFNQLYIGE